jgi:Tol biopolymer transport system component
MIKSLSVSLAALILSGCVFQASTVREAVVATNPAGVLSAGTEQESTAVRTVKVLTGSRPVDVWQCGVSTIEWQPSGQALAYTTPEGLWLVTAPDFTPQRLAEQGIQPKWSPDGQQVVTVWSEEGQWFIQAISLSGGVLHAMDLGDEKSLAIDRWLDNEQLSLIIHRGAPGEELHVVDISQQTISPLVSPEGGTLSSGVLGGRYHWSPDQEFLVVEQPMAVLPGQIAVIDIDRREETHLARFSEGCYQQFESWAPDSAGFLYEQWEGTNAALIAGTTPSLFVWDVVENKGQEISPGVWGASWSPQGNQIAFLLLGNPNQDAQGRITGTDFIPGQASSLSIGVMDAATYQVKTLIPLGEIPNLEAFVAGPLWCGWPRPVWSPDGAWIVYWDAQARLWITSSDGQLRDSLVEPGVVVQEVAWSSDSGLLALRMDERIAILTP